MFKKIMIANRGEIALRIIRACKEMGIETVLVHSEADKDSLGVKYADYSICIGPAHSRDSYLDISRIFSAVEISDVEALHPGYGFLSENSEFAQMCRQCNIKFIGPSPEALKLCGDKLEARKLAKKLGIPVIPGSDDAVKSEKEAVDIAQKIGYPVLIKAAGGGGGRGMRMSHNDASLVINFRAAAAEAEAAFEDSRLYIEKYMENARHIEVQVLVDNFGNAVYLGERDCTLQRRFQKVLEEAPSPVVSASLRRELGNAAIRFVKAVGYTNAGTVEFLVDPKGKFYFIEVNARLQVEHPVTEAVTGIDIVKEQIKIASGHKLSFTQRDVELRGVAIECRINAEDPDDNFKACPGVISEFYIPSGPGVRVDTHAYPGYKVPPFYDSLIAKLIVHRPTRIEAIRATKQALTEFIVGGIKTTIPMHLAIMDDARFINNQITTTFLESVLLKT